MLLKLQASNIFSAVAYIKHLNKDCLRGKNIHTLSLSFALEFEQSKQWCTENSNCGGFTVNNNKAYFKKKDCEINLVTRSGIVAFIKQENQNKCLAY